ncbi:MAG: hypothetical protein J6Y54_03615, partial [Lentisphaeria bacterium]|nr:hypothetical protein [Lentisphaeria bacterium]
CESDRYYQQRAVGRAREFLLKEARELTPTEAARVRFEDPVLLTVEMIEFGMQNLDVGRQPIYITWRMPERGLEYLVFGVSTARMDDWHPNRLIRKTFKHPISTVPAAAGTARNYAVQNLQAQLSVEELNRVRLQHPWVLLTDFEPILNPKGDLDAKALKLAAENARKRTQYSLVWKGAGDNDPQVVFCGLSKPSLEGWQVNFAGVLDADEVRRHTRKVMHTPADGANPFIIPVEKK